MGMGGVGDSGNHHRRRRKHPNPTPSSFDEATAAAEVDMTVSAHSSNPDSVSTGGGEQRKNSNLTFFVTFVPEDARERGSGEDATQPQADETNNSNLWFHRLSVLIQSVFPGSRTIRVTSAGNGTGLVAIAVEIQGESEQHSVWSGRNKSNNNNNNHHHHHRSIQQPGHHPDGQERQQLEEIQQHLYALREQLEAEWMVA